VDRGERLRSALSSARGLNRVINLMDEEELLQALEFESAAQRRAVLIERLIVRLTRVIEDRTRTELQRAYAPWLEKDP
jgi:hypothetical protein